MEDQTSRRKRPRSVDDDDFNKPSTTEKRVRFPKGKKAKTGEEGQQQPTAAAEDADVTSDFTDARLAAKERALKRDQINSDLISEENRGMLRDISAAEVKYEDDESFVDDGIQIEPFNLTKEREEGYFDAQGNYVEYINDKEIKDAWLDSVDVELKFAVKSSTGKDDEEDDGGDLSSQQIGKMKRRIADALEPGETVLRALRRLKGTSNSKEKMSPQTQIIFDQLTEDAMKLMENGDYNVYDEKKEDFEREAEGYERLAQARGEGTSINPRQGESSVVNGSVPNGADGERPSSGIFNGDLGAPSLNSLNAETSTSNGVDAYDMFGEDDGNATAEPPSESGASQNDYVYDESSGYYYSGNLGYYYDPSSGMYCNAASGQWYTYNEETGTYDEIQGAAQTSG